MTIRTTPAVQSKPISRKYPAASRMAPRMIMGSHLFRVGSHALALHIVYGVNYTPPSPLGEFEHLCSAVKPH